MMGNEFASPEQVDSLELELSALSPSDRKLHADLEIAVGHVFVNKYSHSLSDTQIEYWQRASCIVTTSEDIQLASELINLPKERDTEKIVLNNKIFIGYKMITEASASEEEKWYVGGRQLDNGKIVLYRLQDSHRGVPVSADDFDLDVLKAALKDSQSFRDAGFDEKMEQQFRIFARVVASSEFAINLVHEKCHAIQDDSLPMPLREAQAYWIQEQMRKELGIKMTSEPTVSFFKTSFQELYDEFGEDLNQLIWGNLETEEASSLLAKVKDRMTDQFVRDMIPEGFEWTYYDSMGDQESRSLRILSK